MLNTAQNIAMPTKKPHPAWVDVVCIQSQVVYGMVGNNVAVPALKKSGLTVAAVPTVLLSNTPHYPSVHGGTIPVEWLRGFLDDLGQRGALRHLRTILVGYLGHPDQAAVLAEWIQQMYQEIENLLVIIDPVIGDQDTGTYVHPDLIDAYRQVLLPLATGLTPNGYELGQLTNMSVDSEDAVRSAARSLLGNTSQWIAVTSAAPETWSEQQMGTAVVTAKEAVTFHHPKVDCSCKGTGDLFAANLAAYLLKGMNVYQAVEQSIFRVVTTLEQTVSMNCEELVLTL